MIFDPRSWPGRTERTEPRPRSGSAEASALATSRERRAGRGQSSRHPAAGRSGLERAELGSLIVMIWLPRHDLNSVTSKTRNSGPSELPSLDDARRRNHCDRGPASSATSIRREMLTKARKGEGAPQPTGENAEFDRELPLRFHQRRRPRSRAAERQGDALRRAERRQPAADRGSRPQGAMGARA